MEIKTCEEYVLAELEKKQQEIELLQSKCDALKKQYNELRSRYLFMIGEKED